MIQTVAGDGRYAHGGDGGNGTRASVAFPQGLALDPAGNFYIADMGNSRIRRLAPNGIITTVAGTGNFGSTGDGGEATQAAIGEVRGVTLDAAGNLYFSSTLHHRIRRITPAGIISPVVGIGVAGFSGDGGDPRQAHLNSPDGVRVDQAGNLYIADRANNRVRLVSGGTIRTIAGSRLFAFTGDGGPAIEAQLANPTSAGLPV